MKRIRLVVPAPGVGPEEFAAAWPGVVAAAAPAERRPERVAAGLVRPDLSDPTPFTGVEIAWFAALPAPEVDPLIDPLIDRARSAVVVAEESVLRGEDWLERHRKEGAGGLVQMALAHRAAGLSAEEFASRWRAHAGTSASGAPIPDDVRGCAYVQNHPVPPGAWSFDAVNEVYLDDEAALRARIAWFAARPSPAGGLFRPAGALGVEFFPQPWP